MLRLVDLITKIERCTWDETPEHETELRRGMLRVRILPDEEPVVDDTTDDFMRYWIAE